MNADRSVLVGVQELLPRRRRQRFALVSCLPGTGCRALRSVCPEPVPLGVRAFDSLFRASTTAIAPARVYPRPISLLFMGVQFSFMNNSG